MIRLVGLLPLIALGACSSLDGILENRVTCTVDYKQAHYVSLYGPLGVVSKIAKSDAAVICAPPNPANK